MTPVRKVTTFRIGDDLLVAMDALKDRDGMPYSEQIRRALRLFLDQRGIPVKPVKRPAARKGRA